MFRQYGIFIHIVITLSKAGFRAVRREFILHLIQGVNAHGSLLY